MIQLLLYVKDPFEVNHLPTIHRKVLFHEQTDTLVGKHGFKKMYSLDDYK